MSFERSELDRTMLSLRLHLGSKREACEPGHVVGRYIGLGSGKIGQSRSQCMQHLETSTCVYFEMLCHIGSRLFLDNQDRTDGSARP